MNKTIEKINESFELQEEGRKKLEESHRVLSGGPASYYHKKLNEYVVALFERFAPFKTGDRIRIKKVPDCANGWKGSEHFLVLGAEGVVKDVDYRDDRFNAHIVFDDESWISSMDSTITKTGDDNKHLYLMWESQIEKVSSQCNHCGK